MARRQGELPPRALARTLECHVNTVYRWCEQAIAGERSRLEAEAVRKDATGHYWIRRAAVPRLLSDGASDEY